jgi:Family of unknown function (DUF6159)
MFGRAFRLLGTSLRIVMAEKSLLVLPIISMLVSLVVMAVFALGAVGIGLPADGESANPVLYVLVFALYVVLAFVAIYTNSVVIGIAMKRLEGEDATLHDGLAIANANLGAIAAWSIVTATVGMVLRAIQTSDNPVARILGAIAGVGWTVLTFFVVPVLLFEEAGVGGAIKRSAVIFRQRWGEQFIGNASLGLALFLIAIPLVAVSALVVAAVPVLGIALMVLTVAALVSLGGAMSGVFNAALYRFATTGEAGGGFSSADLSSAFRPRRGGRRPAQPGPSGIAG